MLYEMLVGFPPFDGADSYSIGYKHVHEKPVAPPDVVDSRTPPALADDRDEVPREGARRSLPARQRSRRRAHRAISRTTAGGRRRCATAWLARRARHLAHDEDEAHARDRHLRTKHPFMIARGGASEYASSAYAHGRRRRGGLGRGGAEPLLRRDSRTRSSPRSTRSRRSLDDADAWSLEDDRSASMNRAMRCNGVGEARGQRRAARSRGKRLGVPLYKLWGLDPAAAPLSSFTIAHRAGRRRRCAQRVDEAAEYPMLKVKLGTDRDERDHPRPCARPRRTRCCASTRTRRGRRSRRST